MTLKPSWNSQQPPAHLVATEPDPRRWLLGRSQSGIPLHVSGRVNIYGRQEAVADWLVQQVTQMVAVDHRNLVVIDGAGDLVPRLKRKAAVTRLLGEQLVYVDIDGASLAGGFNPLAAAPGETEAALVQRWQCWFQGINVPPHGIHLLAQAQREGVGDMPGLRKWLKQAERQGQSAAISSLGMALNRLTASRVLREWLEWPTNRYDVLPEGTLFFACKATGWDRQQLVRAVLLGVRPVAGVRLVVHGVGSLLAHEPLPGHYLPDLHGSGTHWLPAQVVVSNGPPLPESQLVFTESRADMARRLAVRFCPHEAVVSENLQLLGRQEAVIVCAGKMVWTTW